MSVGSFARLVALSHCFGVRGVRVSFTDMSIREARNCLRELWAIKTLGKLQLIEAPLAAALILVSRT